MDVRKWPLFSCILDDNVPACHKVCWHRREVVSQHDFGEWWALYFSMVPKVFEGSRTDILPCLLRHYHCFKEISLVDILLQSKRVRFSCLAFLMDPVELFGVSFNGPSKCLQPCLEHRTDCLWHLRFHSSCSMATAEDKLPSSISRWFKCKSLYCRSSFPCVL